MRDARRERSAKAVADSTHFGDGFRAVGTVGYGHVRGQTPDMAGADGGPDPEDQLAMDWTAK
jgi:hypothetical protein